MVKILIFLDLAKTISFLDGHFSVTIQQIVTPGSMKIPGESENKNALLAGQYSKGSDRLSRMKLIAEEEGKALVNPN